MSAFLRTASRAAARPSVRAFSSTPSRPIARITIVGNLADTPELRASSTGREFVRFGGFPYVRGVPRWICFDVERVVDVEGVKRAVVITWCSREMRRASDSALDFFVF